MFNGVSHPSRPWHALEVEAVLAELASRPQGLSEAEAEARRRRFGPNRLRPPAVTPAWQRFLRQFRNLLIYVLLVSGLVTALLGEWADSAVIVGVVLINAIVGYLQEGRAEQALAAIRQLLSPRALVRREGRQRLLDATELVPGDLVLLAAGDRVPADLRLIEARGLRIDEAVLTGEALPVDKNTDPVPEHTELADRRDLAYAGTLVSAGQGLGVVVATGEASEVGRISRMLEQVHSLQTPLLRQLERFARGLTVVILALAALTFAVGIGLRGYSAEEMFMAAVGLSVAAIPEGLPAILTIALAIGVQRMARRNAIVRRLPAVEALGAVTVICSDKTGTLTRNEMTVCSVATAGGRYRVEGAGYVPHGAVVAEDGRAAANVLAELARAGVLCNDAELRALDGGRWSLEGEPTEGALCALSLKVGLEPHVERAAWPRLDVIPFAAESRYMATLHRAPHGGGLIAVKGAPEALLPRCDRQRTADGGSAPVDQAFWHAVMDAFAGRGERLLALAVKPLVELSAELIADDVAGGLILLGVVGISDPPREEAIAAVADCQRAGIRVKMITGDHAVTAAAIAGRLGISNARVLTGAELDALDDSALAAAAVEVDVFARASPEHKLRLVEALQARGEVVAMTGDGVNDAPALKRADIGVAMGLKGTEVAKEAAEVVLADDNFASIAHAVEEGRNVYDNLKKAILFILPTNGAEALVLVLAIALGQSLPISPLQILWVNLITAVTLALALAFEPAEADVMRRPPRAPAEPLLSGWLLWRIAFVSVLLLIATFALFEWAQQIRGASLELARTVAVNTLVAGEMAYLFNTRYLLAPVLNLQGLTGNRWVLAAVTVTVLIQLGYTYAPPLQVLFHSAPLPLAWWTPILATAVAVLLLVELEKTLWRRRRRWSIAAPQETTTGVQ